MDGSDYKAGEAKLDTSVDFNTPVLLQGGVEKHLKHSGGSRAEIWDPDASSRELLIEWDIWRNKVAQQVNHNMVKHINSWDGQEINLATRRVESKFPTGVHAGVDFVIGSDQKVLKAEIVEPSGYAEYDALVVKSVYELNKKAKLLRFPENSRRRSVEQVLDFQQTRGYQAQRFLKFGDTERVQLD